MPRLLSMLPFLLMMGCSSSCARPEPTEVLVTIPGTTNRITETPTVADNRDLLMKIYTKTEDCAILTTDDAERAICMPNVDRASGEVRLSFSLQSTDYNAIPLPLSSEHVQILHNQIPITGQEGAAFTLVPHDEESARQLFILVIDGSGSMAQEDARGVSRMAQVRSALLSAGVKDAFFPGDVRTGVAIFQFTDGTPVPLTGKLEVLESKAAYTEAIKQHLRVRNGYTHLYRAVRYATRELLEEEQIQGWLDRNDAEPTVVALTDGFNNVRSSDTCATNAKQLSGLLEHLRDVRRSDSRLRVYTVGLGKPVWPRYTLPNERSTEITPRVLCGQRYRDARIDGGLENRGIDNASLEWIALYGGGRTYVRQGKKDLGKAFEEAAAKRYRWFEARYRVPSSYLRRRFTTTIKLISFTTAEASVGIQPSAWLDAPPGVVAADGWTRPAAYRNTLGVVLPAMGIVVTLMYLGAAGFNTRRVLSGRTRPPRPPQG